MSLKLVSDETLDDLADDYLDRQDVKDLTFEILIGKISLEEASRRWAEIKQELDEELADEGALFAGRVFVNMALKSGRKLNPWEIEEVARVARRNLELEAKRYLKKSG